MVISKVIQVSVINLISEVMGRPRSPLFGVGDGPPHFISTLRACLPHFSHQSYATAVCKICRRLCFQLSTAVAFKLYA